MAGPSSHITCVCAPVVALSACNGDRAAAHVRLVSNNPGEGTRRKNMSAFLQGIPVSASLR